MTTFHSKPPSPFTRCGSAVPRVIAPTRIPSAEPRPRTNQVAISLSAGGYTPARKNPVMKRSGIAAPAPSTAAITMFAAAAPTDPARMTWRGGKTSARLNALDTSAPRTNPSCTAIVSHDAAASPRPHSSRSWGITAEAENHVVIDNTRATANTVRARHRPASGSPTGELEGLCVDESRPIEDHNAFLICNRRVELRYWLVRARFDH